MGQYTKTTKNKNKTTKRQDRKSNGSRQKNKRGDSKVESNDSLTIPDMEMEGVGETSDIPGIPSGLRNKEQLGLAIGCNQLRQTGYALTNYGRLATL